MVDISILVVLLLMRDEQQTNARTHEIDVEGESIVIDGGGTANLGTINLAGGDINFFNGSLSYIGDLTVGTNGLLGNGDLLIDSNKDLALTGLTTINAGQTLTITRTGGEHLRQFRSLSFTATFDGAAGLDFFFFNHNTAYEINHAMSFLDPGDAGSDNDGNGLTALLEYGFAFDLHGRAALPKLLTVLNPGDGKTYPALEFIRLNEATAHSDFTCDVTTDLQTFFFGPGATSTR